LSRRTRLPPPLPLFPYTTLFRSRRHGRALSRRQIRLQQGHGAFFGAIAAQPDHLAVHDIRQHGPELLAFAAVNLVETQMPRPMRSEEHTSELQSLRHLVCRLLLE